MKMTIEFEHSVGDKVWLPDMDCYAIIISVWYGKYGCKYQCRWATDGEYKDDYLFGWEILEKKP